MFTLYRSLRPEPGQPDGGSSHFDRIENLEPLACVPSLELCYNLESHAAETYLPDKLSELYPP